MKISSITNPIAHRTLKTNLGEDVFVVMGSPEPFDDERDYFCPFSIEFKGSTHYGYAGGVDAFQATQLCMYRIGIRLQSMTDNDGLGIRWLDGEAGEFGFPKHEYK